MHTVRVSQYSSYERVYACTCMRVLVYYLLGKVSVYYLSILSAVQSGGNYELIKISNENYE